MNNEIAEFLGHIDKLTEPYKSYNWKDIQKLTDVSSADYNAEWANKYYLAQSEGLYWQSKALIIEFNSTTYELMILLADEITQAIDDADKVGKPMDLRVFRWISRMYKNVCILYKKKLIE